MCRAARLSYTWRKEERLLVIACSSGKKEISLKHLPFWKPSLKIGKYMLEKTLYCQVLFGPILRQEKN